MTTTGLRIRNLPGVLSEVQRLCGDAIAVRFAAAFGDSRLHIPRPGRMKDDHPLVLALGRRAARVIASQLGGQDYQVPTGRHSINHHQVRLMRLAGWRHRAIARVLGIREETVKSLTEDVQPASAEAQPVTICCPCCGRVYKATPPAAPILAPSEEDDETFLARMPPLIRLAVREGAMELPELRRLEQRQQTTL